MEAVLSKSDALVTLGSSSASSMFPAGVTLGMSSSTLIVSPVAAPGSPAVSSAPQPGEYDMLRLVIYCSIFTFFKYLYILGVITPNNPGTVVNLASLPGGIQGAAAQNSAIQGFLGGGAVGLSRPTGTVQRPSLRQLGPQMAALGQLRSGQMIIRQGHVISQAEQIVGSVMSDTQPRSSTLGGSPTTNVMPMGVSQSGQMAHSPGSQVMSRSPGSVAGGVAVSMPQGVMMRGGQYIRVTQPQYYTGQPGAPPYVHHPGVHPEHQFMVRGRGGEVHMMSGRPEGPYMMGPRSGMTQHITTHYQQQQQQPGQQIFHQGRYLAGQPYPGVAPPPGQPVPPYQHSVGPDGASIPTSHIGQISPSAMHSMYPGGMMRHPQMPGSTSPMGYPSQSPQGMHSRQTPPGHTLPSPRSGGPSPHPSMSPHHAMSPHAVASPRSAQSPQYAGPSPQGMGVYGVTSPAPHHPSMTSPHPGASPHPGSSRSTTPQMSPRGPHTPNTPLHSMHSQPGTPQMTSHLPSGSAPGTPHTISSLPGTPLPGTPNSNGSTNSPLVSSSLHLLTTLTGVPSLNTKPVTNSSTITITTTIYGTTTNTTVDAPPVSTCTTTSTTPACPTVSVVLTGK